MFPMEWFGYAGAALMGLTLGLIGGGGSILTVPILVYLFKIGGASATFHSLLVVGVCALVGMLPYARRGLVQFRTALIFLVPAMMGVAFSRRLVLPSIPSNFSVAGLDVSKDILVLVSFALVMIIAAASMILKRQVGHPDGKHLLRTAGNGLGVGALTGFVGAGGGFLIVPALVNGVRIPMEKAVGTSLLIIGINSLFGFLGDFASGMPVAWSVMVPVTAIALLGIVVGTRLNAFISPQKLKTGFGWFVLVVGTLILLKQMMELSS